MSVEGVASVKGVPYVSGQWKEQEVQPGAYYGYRPASGLNASDVQCPLCMGPLRVFEVRNGNPPVGRVAVLVGVQNDGRQTYIGHDIPVGWLVYMCFQCTNGFTSPPDAEAYGAE